MGSIFGAKALEFLFCSRTHEINNVHGKLSVFKIRKEIPQTETLEVTLESTDFLDRYPGLIA
jgi:hypothetical protein